MNWENLIRQHEIITNRRFQFAFECLHKVTTIKLKKNIVLSPYSVYEELLNMSLIVSDNIEEQLKRILNLSDFTKADLINYCHYNNTFVKTNYTSIKSFYIKIKECVLRDRLFLFQRLTNIKDLMMDTHLFYQFPINIMRFINRRLEEAMNDGICDSVKLSVGRLDMEFVFFNVLRLHVSNSEIQMFKCYLIDPKGISTSPDKRKRRSFFCYELSVHVSEFSYGNDNTSLYVLLPALLSSEKWMIKLDATETDISDLIERLSTEEGICKFRKMLDSETISEVDIALSTWPIFRVERNLKIRELLRILGAEQLLMPEAIDLKVFEEDPQNSVHLGNAVHRAGVKITEEDIIASTITVFYTGQESSPSTKYVEVNYNFPFVWLIYDKQDKNVLFTGVFNKFAESASQN